MHRTGKYAGKILLIALAVAASLVHAQDALPSEATIQQWIQGPEVRLPGWSVHVRAPALTFQLRQAVAIRARGDIEKAHFTGHEMHVYVRVADRKGWLPIPRHSHLAQLPRKADVMVSEDFFARPGDYRIAFIVYDAMTKKHGTWLRSVHVPEPDLPLAWNDVPEIEFIDAERPLQTLATPAALSIETNHPLRIDLVVNLTERAEMEMLSANAPASSGRHQVDPLTPDWMLDRAPQDVMTESLLSIAEALSAFHPNGCVKVSAFDAIRAKAYLDRSKGFDTAKLLEELKHNRNVAVVDQHTLALRERSAEFFRKFVQEIVDDNSACKSVPGPASRAVILVSDEMLFPNEDLIQSVEPNPAERNTQYFFLRLAIPDYGPVGHVEYRNGLRLRMASGRFDEVPRLLRDLHPRRFDMSQPKDFERVLLQLKDAISSGGNAK